MAHVAAALSGSALVCFFQRLTDAMIDLDELVGSKHMDISLVSCTALYRQTFLWSMSGAPWSQLVYPEGFEMKYEIWMRR